MRAAAPTGIAAANIEVDGTDIAATTIHALFEFDAELQTKLDFARADNKKVALLTELQLLLLDEVWRCCERRSSFRVRAHMNASMIILII